MIFSAQLSRYVWCKAFKVVIRLALKDAINRQACFWQASFDSHLNTIPTRGGRLCPHQVLNATDLHYTFLVTSYLVTILDNPCSLMQQSKGQKSIFSWGIACKRQNSLHCLGVAQIWNGCRKWRYFKAIKLDKGQLLWDTTWSKRAS